VADNWAGGLPYDAEASDLVLQEVLTHSDLERTAATIRESFPEYDLKAEVEEALAEACTA